MKRLFTLLLITVSIEAFTQDDAATVANSTVHNNYRINFAIPDISAFKALEVDPSNILRPSTVKEVAEKLGPLGMFGSRNSCTCSIRAGCRRRTKKGRG